MRRKLDSKKTENTDLIGDINKREVEIEEINSEIGNLNKEIEGLKKKSKRSGIHDLEGEREQAITDIEDLRKRSGEVEHSYNKLKIQVEKTRNEIEYLNSEKDKLNQNANFNGKIEAFQRSIQKSEKRTQEMKSEMSTMQRAVKSQIDRTLKEQEQLLRSSHSEQSSKIISNLKQKLNLKTKELAALQKKKVQLVSRQSPSVKDSELQKQRDDLDEANRQLLACLDEKNTLYDEVAENTRVL